MKVVVVFFVMIKVISFVAVQVLLNQETWRTCLVSAFGARGHHSRSLATLFKLLRDGKLTTQTNF